MVRHLRQKIVIGIGNNLWVETLATCLGYREGRNCSHRTRSPQKSDNWELWQLCYSCARKLHPEFYINKKNHGVKKEPKIQFSAIPFAIEKLPKIKIH